MENATPFLPPATTDHVRSTNLIIILGMMQVSKRIPLEDPQVLSIVRGVYLLSNLIIAAVYAYTHSVIVKKKGMSIPGYKLDSGRIWGQIN